MAARFSRRRESAVAIVLWSVALAVILFFILFPFGQMLSTALKGPREQFALPVSFLPHRVTLINFQQALKYAPFFRYFLNSLSVSVVTTVIAVFIALFGAYGFSRLHFPGRKFFLTLIVFSQMFCLAAIIIPIYRIFGGLGLIDSYPGLIIAFLTFSVPIAIWLLRSFLHNIPPQLEEAAHIEGASKFQAFWRVVVPLLQPAIGATGAYVFFLTWQDFLFPLVIMTGKEHRTLPIGIMDFVGQYETNWGNLMASSILIVLPVLVIFVFIQRQLIAGLVEGAVKE
jgi:multiple sugar transport system permease protein/raffinose/stachyose/melibiose transport system permease protein